MTKFYCSKKSTITVTFENPPIRVDVFNDNGKLYYFRELGGNFKTIKFNICHKGHYTISEDCVINEITDINIIPVNVVLPPPDRNREKEVSIVFNKNMTSTPARINTKTGVIEIGKRFKLFPFPIRLFILCHEVGHFFYSKEENADLYACKIYVDNGYNKSNALYSLTKVLSVNIQNEKRILELFKKIQS